MNARNRKIEYACDMVESNFWVHIGLLRNQRALLTKTGKRWGIKKNPCAKAARIVIMLALADLPSIEQRWRQSEAYAEAEGFDLSRYLDGMAAHALEVNPATKGESTRPH